MDANKTKSHLATSQQSSQRCFSTYLILLTIKGSEGSAREGYKAAACPVQPAHMITLSRMMSARNQTSAQWQMHTAECCEPHKYNLTDLPTELTGGWRTNAFIFISAGLREGSCCFSNLEIDCVWIPVDRSVEKCETSIWLSSRIKTISEKSPS